MATRRVAIAILGEDPRVASVAAEALELMGLELAGVKVHSVPVPCLDEAQEQLRAECVAAFVRSVVEESLVALGIVGADAYVPGLNFVFGLALPSLRVATVYTPRLRIGASYNLFRERLVKEVMHELGHVYGLSHCPNRLCVMSFSNSLLEVDMKRPAFCRRCASLLRRAGLEPRALLE